MAGRGISPGSRAAARHRSSLRRRRTARLQPTDGPPPEHAVCVRAADPHSAHPVTDRRLGRLARPGSGSTTRRDPERPPAVLRHRVCADRARPALPRTCAGVARSPLLSIGVRRPRDSRVACRPRAVRNRSSRPRRPRDSTNRFGAASQLRGRARRRSLDRRPVVAGPRFECGNPRTGLGLSRCADTARLRLGPGHSASLVGQAARGVSRR